MSTDAAPTITEFLLARIAEDEADLESTPSSCKHEDDFDYGGTDDYQRFTIGYGRAVAECAAKRAIISLWEPSDLESEDRGLYFYAEGTGDAVKALAAIYSNHPDYQQEWALDGAR